MMKNAIIFHGTSCSPNSYWLPNIKTYLETRGYEVWVPQLPGSDTPDLKIQLPYVLENGQFSEHTVLIGHSAGCPLSLSVLENIDVQIHKAVLVAGYARPKSDDPGPELILQEKYDWGKIRQNVREIIFINSDNDPWGCNDREGYYMFENLGGTLIIRHGEGHMGSDTFNQPYKEFPLLEKLL
ncbi:MAG: alpha/beta hydrolase [Candidatus Aenigmarchaeota archaeon]|nr:alpha/beta hydrolase [Candidatus Aenigmarchaeota archaeon]